MTLLSGFVNLKWRYDAKPYKHHAVFFFMLDSKQNDTKAVSQRIKLTTRLTVSAYDALVEIQHRHRRKTGSALPLWKILDAAIITYARKQRIGVGE